MRFLSCGEVLSASDDGEDVQTDTFEEFLEHFHEKHGWEFDREAN